MLTLPLLSGRPHQTAFCLQVVLRLSVFPDVTLPVRCSVRQNVDGTEQSGPLHCI